MILITWIAYSLTPAYQQTLTIDVPFTNTYRCVSTTDGSINSKSQIDHVKVKIAGLMRRNAKQTIIPAENLKHIVIDTLVKPYENSLLINEADIFTVDELKLKKVSLPKKPTLENLSILFFNKLSVLLPKIGGQLVNVSVYSDKLKASNLRYKSTDYSKFS